MSKSPDIADSTLSLVSNSEVLVKVENAGKIFCRDLKKSLFYGLKDSAKDLTGRREATTLTSGGRPLRKGEFWANKAITFELRRGECLGLIGHNGAGKTTLLKMLNGLIKPDTGSIEMRGRVGALIALGAGFNPILTGRENIYVNGSVLGLSKKEIDCKIDEIIDFAEIGEFINSPVQTYSSGMQVRLGFAIATTLVIPDVLILDEVLAVGDISFTIKCLNLVRKMIENCAVIFVSHNVQMVSQFCSKIMLLENGCIQVHTDNVSNGIESYLSLCEQSIEVSGSGEVSSQNEYLFTDKGVIDEPRSVVPENNLHLFLLLIVTGCPEQVGITVILKDNSGRPVASYIVTTPEHQRLYLRPGENNCKIDLGCLNLTPGRYYFTLSVEAENPSRYCLRKEGMVPFTVKDNGSRGHVWAPISRTAIADVALN